MRQKFCPRNFRLIINTYGDLGLKSKMITNLNRTITQIIELITENCFFEFQIAKYYAFKSYVYCTVLLQTNL